MGNVRWVKARKSDNGGDCVELAFGDDGRSLGMVRDSKSPERGHISVTSAMLAALLRDAKAGQLDLP